jgi:hypothetical protein
MRHSLLSNEIYIEDAIFNRKPPPPNMATQNVSKKL